MQEHISQDWSLDGSWPYLHLRPSIRVKSLEGDMKSCLDQGVTLMSTVQLMQLLYERCLALRTHGWSQLGDVSDWAADATVDRDCDDPKKPLVTRCAPHLIHDLIDFGVELELVMLNELQRDVDPL